MPGNVPPVANERSGLLAYLAYNTAVNTPLRGDSGEDMKMDLCLVAGWDVAEFLCRLSTASTNRTRNSIQKRE